MFDQSFTDTSSKFPANLILAALILKGLIPFPVMFGLL